MLCGGRLHWWWCGDDFGCESGVYVVGVVVDVVVVVVCCLGLKNAYGKVVMVLKSWKRFSKTKYMFCLVLIQYAIDWALVDIRIIRIFALNFIKWEWKFGDVFVRLYVKWFLCIFPLDYLI